MKDKRQSVALPHISQDKRNASCSICGASVGFTSEDAYAELILRNFINAHIHEEEKYEK